MRLVLILAFAVVAASCGATQKLPGVCDVSCQGCCAVDGSCLAGNAGNACGVSGAACIDCGGGTCLLGVCVPSHADTGGGVAAGGGEGGGSGATGGGSSATGGGSSATGGGTSATGGGSSATGGGSSATGGGTSATGGGTGATGGGASTGGGAGTGGGFDVPPVGDLCDQALTLTSGVTQTITPSQFAKDYQFNRRTPSAQARDVVFSITVAANKGVTFDVVPDAPLDVAVEQTSFQECGQNYQQFADVAGAGVHEVVAVNTSGAQTIYVIVYAAGSGAFRITATVSSTVQCTPTNCAHGCCAGTQCFQGDAVRTSYCGGGGASCSTCNSTDRCRAHACTPITGTTGGVCVADTDCYLPVAGDRTCETYWPEGGYCRSTCYVVNASCGGLSGPGWCTTGFECLAKCPAPGTGRSTCAANYLCDYADPSNTASQGICVPECGLVECARWNALNGSCQPDGTCR